MKEADKAELRALARSVLDYPNDRDEAAALATAVSQLFPEPCVECGRDDLLLCFVMPDGSFAASEKTPGGRWLCDHCLERLRGKQPHDPHCDELDVDPAIGRPTKPCNCRVKPMRAIAVERNQPQS